MSDFSVAVPGRQFRRTTFRRQKGLHRDHLIGGGLLALGLLILLVALTAFRAPFTVGRGDALIPHVGYSAALDIAKQNGLLVYVVSNGTRTYVTPDQARRYKRYTDGTRVVVRVQPGDTFSKAWWHWRYTPGPRR